MELPGSDELGLPIYQVLPPGPMRLRAALVVNACCVLSNNLMSAQFRAQNSTLMPSGFSGVSCFDQLAMSQPPIL